jgi:zinc/manganese transport system permease protein
MRHALLAGTGTALAAAIAGYFLVLRTQVFTSDALGHVAYTGALGALAFGFNPRAGLLIATVLTAGAMAGLGLRARPDDVVIGSTFAWILGLGSFFLTLYTTRHSAANSTANVTYLFGSIFGLSATQATWVAAIAFAACVLLVLIARPLLFASLDEAVAAARGVPVRLLGVGFLLLFGVVAAESTQAVGGLLLLGLVAAPAGAAHRLTTRPYLGIALAGAIGVGSMWVGLLVSFYAPDVPPSFAILAAATLAYLASAATTRRSDSGATGRLGVRLFQGAPHVRRSSHRPTGASPFGRRAGRTRPHHP